jgi:bile acid acyltransferase/acyl-CoA thioester hydrolase-like protein
VEGLQDQQLTMGGTPRADAEAGIDAWRNVLRFLEDAVQSRNR